MAARQFSFSKAKRLTNPAEFALIRKTGRVQRGSLLTIAVVCRVGTPGFRAGFVTSKRIGSAVTRNRVRRRLREIVRRRQNQLQSGAWIVTIARAAATHASYHALEDEWLRLARRASILAA